MAGTDQKAAPREMVQTPPMAPTNGRPTAAARGPVAEPKAYELTDPQGHRAYLWRSEGMWTVEAADASFRRRILEGLKQPISSIEYEWDETGERWCVREEIQPEDRRYANRLLRSWGQIGLENVEVRVVRRRDREPVWPPGASQG